MGKSENSLKNKSGLDPAMEELVIGGATYTTRLNSKFKNREIWSRPDERKVKAVIPGEIKKIMIKEAVEVTQATPLFIL